MSTKTDRRAEEIMKRLLGHGEATVEELVDLTGTSAPSVRRDLIALERRGLIRFAPIVLLIYGMGWWVSAQMAGPRSA